MAPTARIRRLMIERLVPLQRGEPAEVAVGGPLAADSIEGSPLPPRLNSRRTKAERI
jgi:hypothetical protein